jgi:cytoskeletal protein RodZ
VKADTNQENKKEEEDNEEEKNIWVFRWQTPVIVIMIGIIGFLVWNSRQQRANTTNILPDRCEVKKLLLPYSIILRMIPTSMLSVQWHQNGLLQVCVS